MGAGERELRCRSLARWGADLTGQKGRLKRPGSSRMGRPCSSASVPSELHGPTSNDWASSPRLHCRRTTGSTGVGPMCTQRGGGKWQSLTDTLYG